MNLLKGNSFGSYKFFILIVGLILTACHSGRLILRTSDSTSVADPRSREDDQMDDLKQDEGTLNRVHSAVSLNNDALDQREDEKVVERLILFKDEIKKVDQDHKKIAKAKITAQPETKYSVQEVKNRQYTSSGLMMILVSVFFVFLGLVFLYYVPYLGPVLAVVFFIAALIYLIVGLYNILMF